MRSEGIKSASSGYTAAIVAFFILWAIHLTGAFYDAFQGIGGSVSLWVTDCSDEGGLCVSHLRTDEETYFGIRIGDEILELGGVSSLPRDQISFRQAMSSDFDGTVVVRRGAEQITLTIPVPRYSFQLIVAVKDLVIGLIAILIVIYSKPSRIALALVATLFLIGSTGEGAAVGPDGVTAHVLVVVNLVSQFFLWPALNIGILLILRPDLDNRYLSLCFGFTTLSLLLACVYYGKPFSPSVVLQIFYASFLVMLAIEAVLVVRLYPATTGRSRRQANWVVGGLSLTVIVLVLSYLISQFAGDEKMVAYLLGSELSAVIVGLTLMGLILFDDFIPINKAAVVSASYAILALLFALVFEFVLEPLVVLTSEASGVDSDIGQTILIVAVVLAAPKLKGLITPYVESRILEQNG